MTDFMSRHSFSNLSRRRSARNPKPMCYKSTIPIAASMMFCSILATHELQDRIKSPISVDWVNRNILNELPYFI